MLKMDVKNRELEIPRAVFILTKMEPVMSQVKSVLSSWIVFIFKKSTALFYMR